MTRKSSSGTVPTARRVTPMILFSIGESRLRTKSLQLTDYVIRDLSSDLGIPPRRCTKGTESGCSATRNPEVELATTPMISVEGPQSQPSSIPTLPSTPPLLIDEQLCGESCETLPVGIPRVTHSILISPSPALVLFVLFRPAQLCGNSLLFQSLLPSPFHAFADTAFARDSCLRTGDEFS